MPVDPLDASPRTLERADELARVRVPASSRAPLSHQLMNRCLCRPRRRDTRQASGPRRRLTRVRRGRPGLPLRPACCHCCVRRKDCLSGPPQSLQRPCDDERPDTKSGPPEPDAGDGVRVRLHDRRRSVPARVGLRLGPVSPRLRSYPRTGWMWPSHTFHRHAVSSPEPVASSPSAALTATA